MHALGDALDTLTTEYLKQDPEPEDSASDKDGDELAAAESDEEILDETIPTSPIRNRTRSMSKKFVDTEPLLLLTLRTNNLDHSRPSKRNSACDYHKDTMAVHSCSSTSIQLCNGSHTDVHSCSSTTISKGDVCGHTSIWLYDETYAGFPSWALLAVQRGERLTSKLQQVELPRLARPKWCFAAYNIRSIDELSGRITGIHQVRFSPRHRRDSRAGTTILH
jgi:hypothetical protein